MRMGPLGGCGGLQGSGRAVTLSAVDMALGEGAARTGTGEDGGGGADTHVTVVLSNCSSRLSMADDCKYGSSLSVCLSVRSVSVLASPVLVLCGCPCPAHTLLRLLTWSSSWSPPLPGTGSWLAHASGPSGMWWVERSRTDGQCRDVGRDGEKGWEGTVQCHVTRDCQSRAPC